jgi:acetyl-CoA carboxylase biotin carboxyl carrier protein
VADDKRDAPRPFDVRTVEYLLNLMSQHDLSEVDLKEGDQRIRLRKGSAAILYPTHTHAPTPAPAVAVSPSPTIPTTPPATPAAQAKTLLDIKSPMVGTFYSKPDPKKPDFVTIGARVTPKTVVCTIEAMKLYNEVQADCTGTVAEICVKSGDFVEYGAVLFRIDPS